MDPSIRSDVFPRYEGGVLEIEHCVDDVRNFAHPSERMKLRQRRMIILGVHRFSDMQTASTETSPVAMPKCVEFRYTIVRKT